MNPITQHSLDFLKKLSSNNSKEWFTENKDQYESSHKEMISFAEKVMSYLQSFDRIEEQSGKKSLYRIYRDVRFSKDKTPYKIKWGGYFKRSGDDRRGGFHFDVQPGGKSFIAGGFWAPNKEDLLLIRQQIETDSSPLVDVLQSSEFRSDFGEMLGDKLKNGPKGFDKEHEDIELLKYKQYLVVKNFSDQEVLSPDFPLKMAQGFEQMMPFLNVMTEYLTTDLNGISLLDRFEE